MAEHDGRTDSGNPWKTPRNVTTPDDSQEPIGDLSYQRETRAHTNPWYDALFDDWEFYRRSYIGGRDYVNEHLFKHPQEQADGFANRVQRAVYPNHVRAIVDTYVAQLFKRPVPRSADNAEQAAILEPFWSDITNTGVTADGFYEACMQSGLQYGRCVILVDKETPDPTQVFANRAQELAAGVRPIVRLIEPHNLIDWQVEKNGEFEWAVIRELYDPGRAFNEAPVPAQFRYRHWTRTTWQLFSVEVDEDDEGNKTIWYVEESPLITHGLGSVPLAIAYFSQRRAPHPIAESWVQDIAPNVRRLFNLKSLIDEQLYAHVFNILMVPQALFNKIEQAEWSVTGVIPIEESSEGRVPFVPRYLAPDTKTISETQEQIRVTEGEIRLLSGLGKQNESGSPESGVAIAFRNVDKGALFAHLGSIMTDLEELVNWFALRWVDNQSGRLTENVPSATYAVELDPGQVETALRNALRFATFPNMPDLALKEAVKQAVKAYHGPLVGHDRLQELIQDVEDNFVNSLAALAAGLPNAPVSAG